MKGFCTGDLRLKPSEATRTNQSKTKTTHEMYKAISTTSLYDYDTFSLCVLFVVSCCTRSCIISIRCCRVFRRFVLPPLIPTHKWEFYSVPLRSERNYHSKSSAYILEAHRDFSFPLWISV